MKDFLKNVGATVVGLMLFSVIAGVIGIMGIVGMIASTEATQSTTDNSVLVLKLDGIMEEQNNENEIANLFSDNNDGTLGLQETLSAIKKAKTNNDIKGIYIQGGALGADMAQMQELRDALVDFKKSGKWIIAYGEDFSQGTYYIATTADKIYLNHEGAIDWHGIGGQIAFYKDVLAKVGVKIIPFKCGKYKSATEPFTEDKMSEPSRQQTERYIGGWWNTICQAVSQSRGINVSTLNSYADRVISMEPAENMVKYKMVDGLLYNDEIKGVIKKKLGLGKDDVINQLSVADMANIKEDTNGDEIAVYYAYGDIVNETPKQAILQNNHYISGQDMCDDLESLADNDDIKAVVIRVNSGGGSAYASEQLWHAVQKLKAKKPVVISMGGAAASGAYYLSCAANYIFAEPTTITGSIGIFGMVFNKTDLMTKKLGIKYDEVKTNRNSTFGSADIPMTTEQMGFIQTSINRGYMLFKSRVAAGRKMSMERVEELAQGHVYLGEDAIKINLVDELGGLDRAVAKAAQLAKVKTWYAESYPEPMDMVDQLLNSGTTRNNFLDEQLRLALGTLYEPFMLTRSLQQMDAIQARMPFRLQVN